MKNHIKTTLFLLSSFLLQSCDCLQKVEGKVYDEFSMKPLADVQIHKKGEAYQKIKTDSEGKFSFSDIDGGKNCKNVILIFEKDSFKNDTITFSANDLNVIIKLKK